MSIFLPKNAYDKEELLSARLELRDRLEKSRKSGVELFVDGRAATPDEIAAKCVLEDYTYMADYVLGDEGKLKQLRFDRIDSE